MYFEFSIFTCTKNSWSVIVLLSDCFATLPPNLRHFTFHILDELFCSLLIKVCPVLRAISQSFLNLWLWRLCFRTGACDSGLVTHCPDVISPSVSQWKLFSDTVICHVKFFSDSPFANAYSYNMLWPQYDIPWWKLFLEDARYDRHKEDAVLKT